MKIALLGYGAEARSAYNYYLRKFPDARFEVYDNSPVPKYEIPINVKFVGGVKDFYDIKADIIIRTPAISPAKVSSLGKITSVTTEFFESCQAPIIGVTGTKGKGTTCSLIAEILKSAGKKVWLVGNIGLPALDVLDQVQLEDIVVYELSSFQLWDLNKSPHIAVVLMIESEHLNVHTDKEEYIKAKCNIGKYQTEKDFIIFYKENKYTRQIVVHSLAQKIAYPDLHTAHTKGDYFWYGSTKLCSVENLKIPGIHNQENACAAITAVNHWTQEGEVIARGLSAFKGLPHRLKFLREVDGIKYYDDSYGTTPSSSIAAIKAFKAPKIIILGGSDKGANYEELANVIKQSNVRKVILIGNTTNTKFKTTATVIEAELKTEGYENIIPLVRPGGPSMSEVTRAAHHAAQNGDVVILSTACASFDMFKNVTDRGNQFIAAVEAL